MSDSYALDDAAVAALWGLRLQPDEHMGALYGRDGDLSRSNIITRQGQSKVSGTLSIGGRLRALFHNHPPTGDKDFYGARFSPEDKAQANRLKVPSYITTADGRVFAYDPSNGRKGEEVLAEFPWDEFKAHMMRTLLDREPEDPRGLLK